MCCLYMLYCVNIYAKDVTNNVICHNVVLEIHNRLEVMFLNYILVISTSHCPKIDHTVCELHQTTYLGTCINMSMHRITVNTIAS